MKKRNDLYEYLSGYTSEDIQKLISESESKTDFFRKLFDKNISMTGTLYRFFIAICKKYNVYPDFNVRRRQGSIGGVAHGKSSYKTFYEYIESGSVLTTPKIKKKLFEDGLKERKCEKCFLKEWNEAEIPLELHHIDGDTQNSSLNNLMILCPNCHAQTDNYKSKNKSKV